MNNNLILRTLTSPYGDTNKGGVLSHSDVDNNFIFLKGETIYTATTDNSVATLTKLNGETISFNVGSGSGGNTKHWLENEVKVLAETETVVISGNYVLKNTTLTLSSGSTELVSGGIIFNNYAQLYIGGYLLLLDSNIINNGSISVGGAIILSGASTITGNGNLI